MVDNEDAIRQLVNDTIAKALEITAKQVEASRSFVMTSSYIVQHKFPAITIDGNIIVAYPGELVTIVALPGSGKTQVGEALASAYMVSAFDLQEKDTLRICASYKADSKCLYVDTERPHDDNFKSYGRIMRRTGADIEEQYLAVLDYRCFVSLAETQLLKDELERLCTETSYGLIIIDGALDLVASMNSEEECSAMVKWLRTLAHNCGCAIVVTLHPNKGTDTMAGHLGAMLYRYSRACLVIKPHEQNSDIKILTNQFSNGKLSHGGGEISVPFGWDNEAKMMVTLPDEAAPVNGRVKVSYEAIEQLFNSYLMAARFWIPSIEVKQDYAERFDKSEKTARDHISYAIQHSWLESRGKGPQTEYKLIPKP